MNLDTSLATFSENITSVWKLINFDTEVRDIALGGVQTLHEFLKNEKGFDNPKWNGERTLQILQGIRQSPVLKERYSTIYNQAVVLLVSYFGSVIGDVFRAAAARSLERLDPRVLDTELKLRVSELISLTNSPADQIGDLLIHKEGITFQDMQSTHRAFKQFFGIDLHADETAKNIIVGQACRHAIVHDGGTANSRVMNQIRNAQPRKLKPALALNDRIKFSTDEIELLASEMKAYMAMLVEKVKHA
ncbi:MAG: hypothetical protein Q8K12_14975 [Thiobacillus sp.]|nr:hypothetical protein [Thiobacillus sp.]